MRVLVLTASYGSGHNAAARSLALALAAERADVTMLDYFRDLVHPRFEQATRLTYTWILRHARGVWGLAYAMGDRMPFDSPMAFGITRVGMGRLATLLARERFDAVVTVHATPAVVMAALATSGGRTSWGAAARSPHTPQASWGAATRTPKTPQASWGAATRTPKTLQASWGAATRTPKTLQASWGAATRSGHTPRIPPHTTVVTDFVAHAQWMAPGIDRYCVAAAEVGHEFIARGIAPDRVLVTGVPVRPEFDEPLSGADARRSLGLPSDMPIVLAMAGSDPGLGRLDDVASALERLARPVHAVFVAGRDAGLAERLRRRTAGRPARVLPYVEDMRRLMAAADLLVTKAGGMTLAEALAAELPMVIYGSLPGQERRNERFASRAGVALVAHAPIELTRAIDRALGDDELLDHLRARIRDVRRPHGARRIARVILGDARAAPAPLASDDAR